MSIVGSLFTVLIVIGGECEGNGCPSLSYHFCYISFKGATEINRKACAYSFLDVESTSANAIQSIRELDRFSKKYCRHDTRALWVVAKVSVWYLSCCSAIADIFTFHKNYDI